MPYPIRSTSTHGILCPVVPLQTLPHSPVVEVCQTHYSQKSNHHGGTQQHSEELHCKAKCVVSFGMHGPSARLHVTSQTLRNHFRVARQKTAKEVCPQTPSTHSVVGVDATKNVQLPISSESTGLVVIQWFNRVALITAQLELLRRQESVL